MKSKKTLLFSLLALALLPLCVARAVTPVPSDFAYGMHLPITDPNGLYTLKLPLGIYEKLYYADQSDLQVFNGAGEVVPQALQRAPLENNPIRTDVPFFPLPPNIPTSTQDLALMVQRSTAGTILSIQGTGSLPVGKNSTYLLDLSQSKATALKLVLNWQQTTSNQIYTLAIAQSNDLSHWQLINPQAVVARLSYQGAEVLRQDVSLSGITGRYLRLTCRDCKEPFLLTQVTAFSGTNQSGDQYQWFPLMDGSIQEEQGWYRVSYENPARFGVQALDLEFPQANSLARVIIESRPTPQDTWQRVAGGDFFRLDMGKSQLTSNFRTCSLNTDRYWRLSLAQSSALSKHYLPKLTLGWRPEALIFLGRGPGPYTLAFGSSGRAQIDITQAALVVNALAQNGEKAPLTPVTPGPRFALGGEQALMPQPATIDWQRILLWGVLIAGVLTLGFMAWTVSREMNRRKG
jgi:hypothetical protein